MFVSLDVFLFKQKTAYEMRISDWSSDVCSSDLIAPSRQPEIVAPGQPFDSAEPQRREFRIGVVDRRRGSRLGIDLGDASRQRRRLAGAQEARSARPATEQTVVGHGTAPRSEEHTSELQSLMRSSCADFCLQKKTTQ